jgi:hypothetical protein
MALNEDALAAALKAIYAEMDAAAADSPKNNDWLAEQVAKAITDQIKTAKVAAGIGVTIPATSAPGQPSQGTTSAQGSLV